jgi:hypothetical protein
VRIYYAHCMAIYNTPQEARDIDLLETIFSEFNYVVNPNKPEINLECNQLREQWNENRLDVDVPGYPGGT